MNEETTLETTNGEIPKIEYRLDAIEKAIGELKDYIIETKLQQKDIDLIYNNIQDLENKIEKLSNRIEQLEKKPANMFENMISYAVSALIGGLVGYFLFKLGLTH